MTKQPMVFLSWLRTLLLCSAGLTGWPLMAAEQPAVSHEALLEQVYKMPAWVDQVTRVCPWQSNEGQGYVRVVRTEQGGRHQLFFQWIRKGMAGTPTQAISTVQVEELAGELAVKVELPRAQLHEQHCQLKARAENLTSERRYMLTFYLIRPGEYKLSLAGLYSVGPE